MILEEILKNLKSKGNNKAYTINDKSYSYDELYKYICNIYKFILLNNKEKKPIIVYGHKEVYMKATFLACSFAGITYVPIDEGTPKERVDLIYLCFPNNPTGTVLDKNELEKWVKYARENKSIILYDAAYEAFITEENIPHSIYEIDGAKEVAIEFKSYSKTAGFTGVRCGYVVIPEELKGYTENGEEISLNKLWNRRTCTKFNGTPYITQRAAQAIYTEEGQKQIRENINYYLENAKIIREGLEKAGFKVYGGVNSPYIWLKIPEGMTSWEFFDKLLDEANVVGTPGSGFGPHGEGYFRLTAFNTKENTVEAIERIKNM